MVKTKQIFGLIITLVIFGKVSQAQQTIDEIKPVLEGYWEGGFIKGNSYQKFEIQFYERESKLFSLQIMEEWHPEFGEFELEVEIDSSGQINMNTGLGKAQLQLDRNNHELIGSVSGQDPPLYIHLKKIPDPPSQNYLVEEIKFKNDTIELSGHFHKPKFSNGTALILVGGRGCFAGSTKYNLYAKVLRSYGVSVLAFDKRGTGGSGGDCSKATISDLAEDVSAAYDFIRNNYPDISKIGALGSSAGGWVMFKTAEQTDFDFLISVVGPSTSVYDQQMQSLEYGIEEYELSEKARQDSKEYTELVFKAEQNKRDLKRMKELLILAERDKWMQLLDETDKVYDLDDIPSLWVRRHNYDPANSIRNFNKPYLAVFGEKDWIVPYRENTKKLKTLRSGLAENLTQILIAYDAGHGVEVSDKKIELENNVTYWRFFRNSPSLLIEIVNFLRTQGLIPQ